MNAKSEHLLEKISRLDTSGQQHYPNSRKVYVEGSRADLKVPMREISLTATQTEAGIEENPPIRVYDTSGIYSDTDSTIDLRAACLQSAAVDRGATGGGGVAPSSPPTSTIRKSSR